MAKQKPNKKKQPLKPEIKETKPYPLLWVPGVLILIIVAHFPSLFNGFTNWDDPSYVTQNNFIKGFSAENLTIIFGEFHNGHYHPLTWLSLAFDYSLFKLNPLGYHLINLLIHLINVYFVYFFIKLLSGNWKVAIITSLLFGISPLTVESVAWVSERKNLLYTLFFLASIISYLKFLEKSKLSLYFFSVFLFVLSLLSKSMAITLPVVLLLIDYFKNRLLFSRKVIIEKLPFIIISVAFGIAAFVAQSMLSSGNTELIPWVSKIMYGSWGLLNYFARIFIPFKLSAFYPFLPWHYPSYYLTGIVFTLLFIWFVYRSWKKEDKTIVFGLVFFLINLVLLLKFFNSIANSVYIADRYTYVSSIGLFFILSTFLSKLKNKTGIIIFVVLTAYYGIYTYNQSKAWKNSISLWNNVIKQYPGAHIPLLNRGNAFREEKQYTQALADYDLILHSDPAFFEALVNRGYVYDIQGNYTLALNDYEKALTIKPNDKNTLYNNALCLQKSGKNEEATVQVQNQIKTGNGSAESYNILGNASFSKNDFTEAIDYYSKAVEMDPQNALYWYNRANSKAMIKKQKEALADYDKAIELDQTNSDYFFNRGTTRYFIKDFKGAKKDMESAVRINPENITYYLNKSNIELALGNNDNAIKDLTSAINLDVNNAQNYTRRAIIYFRMNKTAEGCKDAYTSVKLGFSQANELLQKYCR